MRGRVGYLPTQRVVEGGQKVPISGGHLCGDWTSIFEWCINTFTFLYWVLQSNWGPVNAAFLLHHALIHRIEPACNKICSLMVSVEQVYSTRKFQKIVLLHFVYFFTALKAKILKIKKKLEDLTLRLQ